MKQPRKTQPRAAEVDTTFGREVRYRRLDMSMTLDVLAERSGLTPNYIGGVETDKRDPSLSTMRKLARGLDIPLSSLFGANVELSPTALEAAKVFDSAPEELQASILAILRAAPRKRR